MAQTASAPIHCCWQLPPPPLARRMHLQSTQSALHGHRARCWSHSNLSRISVLPQQCRPRRQLSPVHAKVGGTEGDNDGKRPEEDLAAREARISQLEGRAGRKGGYSYYLPPAPKAKAFEEMTPVEKAGKLYIDFLGLSNKLAVWGLFAMVAAWICIRFVGPGLGLYTVVDPFAEENMPPPPGFQEEFRADRLRQ